MEEPVALESSCFESPKSRRTRSQPTVGVLVSPLQVNDVINEVISIGLSNAASSPPLLPLVDRAARQQLIDYLPNNETWAERRASQLGRKTTKPSLHDSQFDNSSARFLSSVEWRVKPEVQEQVSLLTCLRYPGLSPAVGALCRRCRFYVVAEGYTWFFVQVTTAVA